MNFSYRYLSIPSRQTVCFGYYLHSFNQLSLIDAIGLLSTWPSILTARRVVPFNAYILVRHLVIEDFPLLNTHHCILNAHNIGYHLYLQRNIRIYDSRTHGIVLCTELNFDIQYKTYSYTLINFTSSSSLIYLSNYTYVHQHLSNRGYQNDNP